LGNAPGKTPKGKPVSERILLASEEEKITAANSEISYSLTKAACFFGPLFFGPKKSVLLFRRIFFDPGFWLLFWPFFFG
jgi:hypothetical protein